MATIKILQLHFRGFKCLECVLRSAHPILLSYLSQPILRTAVGIVGGDGGDDRLPKQATLSKRNKMQERSRVYTLCIGQSSPNTSSASTKSCFVMDLPAEGQQCWRHLLCVW